MLCWNRRSSSQWKITLNWAVLCNCLYPRISLTPKFTGHWKVEKEIKKLFLLVFSTGEINLETKRFVFRWMLQQFACSFHGISILTEDAMKRHRYLYETSHFCERSLFTQSNHSKSKGVHTLGTWRTTRFFFIIMFKLTSEHLTFIIYNNLRDPAAIPSASQLLSCVSRMIRDRIWDNFRKTILIYSWTCISERKDFFFAWKFPFDANFRYICETRNLQKN